MADSVSLQPTQHDKLGSLHVGVTREGFVSVAGEVHNIDDGQTVEIGRVPISVTRNGSEYTFTKKE